MTRIDKLARKHTAFQSFKELINAPGGYRPSLCTGFIDIHAGDINELADCYDEAQASRQDPRRAHRF